MRIPEVIRASRPVWVCRILGFSLGWLLFSLVTATAHCQTALPLRASAQCGNSGQRRGLPGHRVATPTYGTVSVAELKGKHIKRVRRRLPYVPVPQRDLWWRERWQR